MSAPVSSPPTVTLPVISNPPPPASAIPAWVLFGIGVVGLILIALLVTILVVLVRRR
jgi:hypothetical protein